MSGYEFSRLYLLLYCAPLFITLQLHRLHKHGEIDDLDAGRSHTHFPFVGGPT